MPAIRNHTCISNNASAHPHQDPPFICEGTIGPQEPIPEHLKPVKNVLPEGWRERAASSYKELTAEDINRLPAEKRTKKYRFQCIAEHCKCNGSVYTKKSDIERHWKEINYPGLFKCPFCGFQSAQETHSMLHINTKHLRNTPYYTLYRCRYGCNLSWPDQAPRGKHEKKCPQKGVVPSTTSSPNASQPIQQARPEEAMLPTSLHTDVMDFSAITPYYSPGSSPDQQTSIQPTHPQEVYSTTPSQEIPDIFPNTEYDFIWSAFDEQTPMLSTSPQEVYSTPLTQEETSYISPNAIHYNFRSGPNQEFSEQAMYVPAVQQSLGMIGNSFGEPGESSFATTNGIQDSGYQINEENLEPDFDNLLNYDGVSQPIECGM